MIVHVTIGARHDGRLIDVRDVTARHDNDERGAIKINKKKKLGSRKKNTTRTRDDFFLFIFVARSNIVSDVAEIRE